MPACTATIAKLDGITISARVGSQQSHFDYSEARPAFFHSNGPA